MFLVILVYALLACTFIVAKYAVGLADPLFLIGFRMTVAGTILLLYYYRSNRSVLKSEPSLSWSDSAQVAFFHVYVAFVLEFWALQYLTVSHTTIVYSLTPFITALFSYVLLGERLSVRQVGAVLLGFGGITLSSIMSLPEACGNDFMLLATLVLFLAVVSASYAWFIIKKLLDKGHSLNKINGVSMLYGGIASFVTWGCCNIGSFTQPVADWGLFLLSVGMLILLSNIIVYSLYGFLIQRYSLTFITFAGFLCPIFGSILDYFCFKQPLCIYDIIAIVSVTAGLWLFCYPVKNILYFAPESS